MKMEQPVRRGLWQATVLLAALVCAVDWLAVGPLAADELDDARRQAQLGRPRECGPLAEVAITKRPWAEEGWRLLIWSRMHTGDAPGADDVLQQAIVRFPLSIVLRLQGREVRRRLGFPEMGDRLEEEVRQLVQQAPYRYTDAASLVALGRLLVESGADARQVLELYYDRVRRDAPDYLDGYLAAGELALAKEDFKVAAESYRAALERDPERPAALLGLAKSLDSSDSESAAAALLKALEINPDFVPALLERAEREIDAESYADAEATLERVLATDPDEPAAWALRSVVAHLRGQERDEQLYRRVALGGWHRNPEVPHLIGRKLSQKYRFAEGAAAQREALQYDSEYMPAKLQLCQDLLRLGDESPGWELADEVQREDGYHVVIHNLLQLHDRLAKFRTLETEHFLVRMEAREAEIYGEQVLALLEEARGQLCEKYQHTLQGPVIVEIFPQQADFAIRTFGLPGGAGFLGVCFGRVITANSPASQGASPSNWSSVLWHEFCHVVTLQKTGNRMPRWLSEGISVYEERQRSRSWGQTMTPTYRRMVLEGELTPVSQLSGAFLRPPSPLHLQFAYYESSLVVEYLVERHGLKGLVRVLDDLALGLPANDALARLTGSLEVLDREFAEFARRRAESLAPDADWSQPDEETQGDEARLATWLGEHADSIWSLRRRAAQRLETEDWEGARAPLMRLAELFPEESGDDSPRALLARVCRELGDAEEERREWLELLQVDSRSQTAALRLMELAEAEEDWRGVIEAARYQLQINPLRSVVQERLAVAAERLGERGLLVDSLRAVLSLDPVDPAAAHYRLAAALLVEGDRRGARRHVLRALEEAPRYRDAQRLLLRLQSPQPPVEDWESPGF